MQSVRTAGNGQGLIVLGFAVIAILFVMYGRYQDPELMTPSAIDTIQRIAYGFYITMAAAIGAVALGMHRYHAAKIAGGGTDLLGVVARATSGQRSRRIFTAAFISYGVFFSLLSGTLVYQPGINFVEQYGAVIPSGFVAPCCDAPGYMPKIIIYVTENVGLQIIPINLVLQMTVSYLVALNVSMAAGAYSISRGKRGLGGLGAIAGLFIGCPTCAGTLVSVFAGAATGIVLSAALAQMQTLFIAVSIPLLLATPYLMARKLTGADESCTLKPR